MPDEKALRDQAVDVLRRALASSNGVERWLLVNQALQLNRLAVAQEKAQPHPSFAAEPRLTQEGGAT